MAFYLKKASPLKVTMGYFSSGDEICQPSQGREVNSRVNVPERLPRVIEPL